VKHPLYPLGEIRPLTGVRAFAAYGVMLSHFWAELTVLMPALAVFTNIVEKGGLGVDLFFILSGLIISHVYWSRFRESGRAAFVPYVVNRFARIYPGYFVTLVILVLMVGMAPFFGVQVGGEHPWRWLPAHFLMLQPFPGVPGGWNYPSWSIGAEFFAYLLVFPILVRAFNGLRPVAALLMAPAAVIGYWAAKFGGLWGASEHLPMVTAEFSAGAFLFLALKKSAHVRHGMGMACVPAFLLLLVFLAVPPGFLGGWERVLVVLLFLPVLGGFYAGPGGLGGVFGWEPVVYLGRISYALYLVHALVQKVLKPVVFIPVGESGCMWLRAGAVALYLVAPLLAAAILFHMVEEPAREWIRARRGRTPSLS
jgi:peptidoglycan/LPS O-acetylase OafA/YrhL